MTDPRSTPANQHVAHVSLRGQVEAARFTTGTWMEVAWPILPLKSAPNGPRERELLLGTHFLVLEDRDGYSFGYSGRDSYVGYVKTSGLIKPSQIHTHKVAAIRTYAKEVPDLKDTGPAIPLAFSSLVNVTGTKGAWSEITLNGHAMFIPTPHLNQKSETPSDPVAVAEMFLGTPYLWGGNSAFGIDCSGLVQSALLACGIECPGDADQQLAALGQELPNNTELMRGDLLFWKGHVAICVNSDQMIHANATDMSVVCEGIAQAEARIQTKGDGAIISRKRLKI